MQHIWQGSLLLGRPERNEPSGRQSEAPRMEDG